MNCCATEQRQRMNGRRAMDWAYLLNNFEGRISRQPFWIAMAVITVAAIFCHRISEALQGDRLSAIVDLAFTYPDVSSVAKRAHDRNLTRPQLICYFSDRASTRC